MVQLKAINIFKTRTREIPPVPQSMWQNPLYFVAFGFGSGALPYAPGTFGTIFAIPFYLLLRPLPLITYLIVLACLIAISSYICDKVSRDLKVHDHQAMCLDEFIGFFVTMIHAPIGWRWILLGFILFRLFDIYKPWPIAYLDKNVHGGFGMILDDVMAGIYACLCIQIIAYLLSGNLHF